MKAVVLHENGGPDKLVYETGFPVPEIKPNEVLVKIKATSINRADIVIRNGYPGLNLNFPHILGGDIAGIIEKTGSEVNGFKAGDRIVSWPLRVEADDTWVRKGRSALSPSWKYFGMHIKGSYAEYVNVPESSLIKLPDNVSFEQAACLPVAGLTAYHAVVTIGELQAGDTFFIWGGTSGVGNIAIQLAQNIGADIFTTAGHKHKLDYLHELEVEHVFDHYNDKNIEDEVIEFTNGHGIDVVLDYVGPQAFDKNFKMVTKGGKILFCGILTGRETMVNLHQMYLRHISLLGLYLGEKYELEELVKLVSAKKIVPYIGETLNLKDAAKGHKLIEEGKVLGKVVLVP